MNTTFLETLVWLTRLKSFSQTAQKLNTTQPSVSNRINKLEELLNVRLYDRSARQFELTPAGRRILRHAESIVSLSSEMCELAVSDESTDIHIRIGVIEFATMSWLPEYIESVSSYFPKTSFAIGTGTSDDLLDGLKRDQYDIVFAADPLNEPNISSTSICKLDLAWLANPDKYDCSRPIDIMELADLPVILTRPGSSGYLSVIGYFRSSGITYVPQRHNRITLDCIYSFGTARRMVMSGLGIVALPAFLMEEDIAAGRVGILQVKQPLPAFNLVACYKKPMTRSILKHLIEIAEEAVDRYCAKHTTKYLWR